MNKKMIYLSVACFAASTPLAWAAPTPVTPPPAQTAAAQTTESLNRIVAIVNDEIITQDELDTAILQLKQAVAAKNITPPSEAQLEKDALQELIDYHLQLQLASRAGLQVTESDVDQAILQIAQSHHLTLDQLKQQLVLEKTSYASFKKRIGEQLVINKLQQQMIGADVKVAPADITAFKQQYENAQPQNKEYHLVDFVIALPEQPSDAQIQQALSQARSIQSQLDKGVSIDTIMPPYKDLDWRSQADLPQLFSEQLPQLTPQKASAPLRAPNGYHVLKLMDTRSKGVKFPPDEQLRLIVYRQKYEKAVKAWVEKLRKDAYIHIITP